MSLRSTTILTALICASPLFAQVPDLTKDAQTIDRTLAYNLGATGLRGWIHTKAANNLDAGQGRTTLASRQILVTHVGASTPADGEMQVDDVILGVNGKPFSDDARKGIALAIQEAETECIPAAAELALTQGGHGGESRTGEIMDIIVSYGAAAKPQIPALREVIACFNHETENLKAFPPSLNLVRVGDIEEAIRTIEAASTQPELRSVNP